ncbi:MAG: YdcF family protein [Proteobacteria bacterium]|nr:YdcF family protein [Pseudomonadota bacterium]
MSESAIIVPGYTPSIATRPVRLHPRAAARVRKAIAVAKARSIDWIIVSGGAVHPPGTPFVEADEMAVELIRGGWRKDRIVREPKARHTYTNLRNCGRIMLDRDWATARVVTGLIHALYMGFPSLSQFEEVTLQNLGYAPGTLSLVGPGQLLFAPSDAVRRPGKDPLDR